MYNSDLPSREELPSSKQLLMSTVLAGLVAVALFVAIVLPAEFGVDPTGIGRLTGLAHMGNIKTQIENSAARSDEMSVVLNPGEAAEIKLRMEAGASAVYSWTVDSSPVQFDIHGEGRQGAFVSYAKGTSLGRVEGVLEAAFDGDHGWYWRNRGQKKVTVKLLAKGDYGAIKRVL